jgi:hypothetical protein
MGWLVTRINWPALLIIGSARVTEIFLVFLVLVFFGKGLSYIGLDSKRIADGAMRGIVWSVTFALAAGAIAIVLIIFRKNPVDILKTTLPATAAEITLFFIVGGLIAPAAEEIVFRGLVYGYLRQWGITAAVAGTTLLFVAAHMTSGIPLTQIVGGLVFALAYEKEKNLMVPIVIHVSGNLAIFSLSLI